MALRHQFYNKVTRQGNSLSVRIPSNITELLDIEEGNVVAVHLVNVATHMQSLPMSFIKAYHSSPLMRKFSLQEIASFLQLQAIEETTHEKVKSNERYAEFKHLIQKQDIRESIKLALHKANQTTQITLKEFS